VHIGRGGGRDEAGVVHAQEDVDGLVLHAVHAVQHGLPGCLRQSARRAHKCRQAASARTGSRRQSPGTSRAAPRSSGPQARPAGAASSACPPRAQQASAHPRRARWKQTWGARSRSCCLSSRAQRICRAGGPCPAPSSAAARSCARPGRDRTPAARPWAACSTSSRWAGSLLARRSWLVVLVEVG
jgi:hypothetical protein